MQANCSPNIMSGISTRRDSCHHHNHQGSHPLQDDLPNSTFARPTVQVPDTVSDAAAAAAAADTTGPAATQSSTEGGQSTQQQKKARRKASHHPDSDQTFVASTYLLRASTAVRIQLRNKIRKAQSPNRLRHRVHTQAFSGKKIGDRRKSNAAKEGDHAEQPSQLSRAAGKEDAINNEDNKDVKASEGNKDSADGDSDSLEEKFANLTKLGAKMDSALASRPISSNTNADGGSDAHPDPFTQQQIRTKQENVSVLNRKNRDQLHSALRGQCQARLEAYRRAVKQAIHNKEEERKIKEQQHERQQQHEQQQKQKQQQEEEAQMLRQYPMLASARGTTHPSSRDPRKGGRNDDA